MKKTTGAFLAGAAFMYFADPARGRRRRALLRDRFYSGYHGLAGEFDKAGRDVSNRTRGAASSARSLFRRGRADGSLLQDRVRAALGHVVSHPHAIGVAADDNGRIVLDGPVLRHELERLMRAVEAIRGVREVVNHLDVHATPDDVPGLQGGSPRRLLAEFAQRNWTPSLRMASGAAGTAALAAGMKERGPAGWAASMAGGALLLRSIVNKPFRQILGMSGGAVHIDKSIHIDAPIEDVFRFWSNVENYPRFMSHLTEVRRIGEDGSHWTAAGPFGIPVRWRARMTERRENQLISWMTMPGSAVVSSGLVRFDREGDRRTRVSIRMSYCPPAGVFGHAAAWLLGFDPKSGMDDDLVRVKSLLESGKTRAHGHAITREEAERMPGRM